MMIQFYLFRVWSIYFLNSSFIQVNGIHMFHKNISLKKQAS